MDESVKDEGGFSRVEVLTLSLSSSMYTLRFKTSCSSQITRSLPASSV